MTQEQDELDPIDEIEDKDELDTGDTLIVEDEDEKTAKVDSELDDAEDDEAREEIRARRKTERKNRSQRNRERVESMERNLQALMAQNQALQQQVSSIHDTNVGSQLAQVDSAILQASNAAAHFKALFDQAALRNDGKAMVESNQYMLDQQRRAKELTDFKANATRAINAPKPLNQAMVSKSQQFLGKNTWYGGPSSADPDSKVLTALDNSLTAEGWDSTQDSYWTELEKRAEKYLPHRVNAGKPVPRPANPVAGGTRSSGSSDKGGVFQLSAERRKAIESAGMWDDKATRDKMIKSFRDYDKQHGKA